MLPITRAGWVGLQGCAGEAGCPHGDYVGVESGTQSFSATLPEHPFLRPRSKDEFRTDPTISEAKVFVTADHTWGPDESHYGDRRYFISADAPQSPTEVIESRRYHLEDRYMTVRKYDLEGRNPECRKAGFLARLRRVKAASALRKPSPR